ncbi:MAG TPA: enolase C-terminal domain-like protein [Burkholderiales bacterium]|nr:enolase C-terminal domain-like protein [Burkholderiales bacterium]
MSAQVAPRRTSETRPKLAIERVEVFGVAVPLAGGGFKNAYVTKTVQKSAVVRVTAAGGALGLGNIDPSPGYSTETIEESLAALRGKLAPGVIGADAANIHVLNARLDAAAPGFLDAKAAIEMACVDLTARALGVPVYTYLGGAVRERLSFNAWIGILPPGEAAPEARKWFERGFRSAKIKVGGGIEADRDRVKAVREAVGGTMALRIDANAGYDADTAIRLAHLVQPYDLQLFEQPVPADDLAGMARVRREAGGVAIMADESILDHASLIEVIKAGAADIVKLKVMKQGGFHRTAAMLATAEAAGLRCVIGHGFGLGVNTMAEIMLAATSANVIDGLECVGPLKTVDDITTEKLDLGSGVLALPPGPGLGVALDEAKLARYRFS